MVYQTILPSYLAAQQLPQKALLLVDNVCYHSECQFSSSDRNIVIKFLPANTTTYPMDQGICAFLKHHYRPLLLDKILLSDTSNNPC